jgi:putative inorganic carbon (HCO3(-)) transporter
VNGAGSGRAHRRSIRSAAILLVFAMLLVSLLVSPLPKRSAVAAIPLLGGIAAYVALVRLPATKNRLRLAWWAMIFVVMLLSTAAPVAMLSSGRSSLPSIPQLRTLQRRLPDTINPNVAAGLLAMLAPFCLARLVVGWPVSARGWLKWVIALTTGLVLLAVLSLTHSRGAYVAAGASLLLLLGLRWPRAARWLVLPVLAALAVAGTRIGWRRIADALVNTDATGGLEVRLEIWSRALLVIRDFAFTGVGLGCFEPVVFHIYPLFLRPEGTATHAHNLFLQVAVDLGIPGLAAYLAILGASLRASILAYRAHKRNAQRYLELLSAACVASLAGMCLHGIIDSAVWGNKGAFLPWVVMGLSVALYRASTSRPAE